MFKKIILTASIIALSGVAAFAQATKVGIIDLQQVMQGFSKTPAVMKALEERGNEANNADKQAIEEMNALRSKVQKADKEFQNPMLSDKKKEEIKNEAIAILQELKQKEQTLLETRKSVQAALQQMRINETNKLLQDITPRIRTVAKTRGCDLVINSNSVIFAEPHADITKDVIDLLAKDFPAEKETEKSEKKQRQNSPQI